MFIEACLTNFLETCQFQHFTQRELTILRSEIEEIIVTLEGWLKSIFKLKYLNDLRRWMARHVVWHRCYRSLQQPKATQCYNVSQHSCLLPLPRDSQNYWIAESRQKPVWPWFESLHSWSDRLRFRQILEMNVQCKLFNILKDIWSYIKLLRIPSTWWYISGAAVLTNICQINFLSFIKHTCFCAYIPKCQLYFQ